MVSSAERPVGLTAVNRSFPLKWWLEGSSSVDVQEFISRWKDSGGAELANSQSFLKELCALLEVPQAESTHADESHNKYVFERRGRLTTETAPKCWPVKKERAGWISETEPKNFPV
jgi:hypothetical protein